MKFSVSKKAKLSVLAFALALSGHPLMAATWGFKSTPGAADGATELTLSDGGRVYIEGDLKFRFENVTIPFSAWIADWDTISHDQAPVIFDFHANKGISCPTYVTKIHNSDLAWMNHEPGEGLCLPQTASVALDDGYTQPFLSNTAPVPLPSSLALLGAAILGAWRFRK